MGYFLVFIGAGAGGVARHAINVAAMRLLGVNSFPFGTLAINVLGSVLMGVVVEIFARRSGLPQELRLFLTTGVLGGFTTFSSFSLETVALWERGEGLAAFVYVVASCALSLGAMVFAMFVLRAFMGVE